jgi:hypothetical protein
MVAAGLVTPGEGTVPRAALSVLEEMATKAERKNLKRSAMRVGVALK